LAQIGVKREKKKEKKGKKKVTLTKAIRREKRSIGI
jgi:hypothetical protein